MLNVYEWFVYSSMKTNPENFQFILLGNRLPYIANRYITTKSVSSVGVSGITIDCKLNFKEHINNIIKKAYCKVYTLQRL